ncbi:MAG TPA: ribonucleotide reductase, partial [Thermosynechococcus sp. M46_R2017_013]|nr:ribonucleotide reductase [Thermosynechococcus sp. M46_R2017_013]
LLAFYQVKYKDFVHALKLALDGVKEDTEAYQIAENIVAGYTAAARVAMSHNMERAFCIAPTANTSFQYKDMRGYITTPEISPPIARNVIRVSETCQQVDVKYPPDCETAAEVGWDVYFDLICQWQRLMNITGLAHSISANWWSDYVVMNESFIDQWLKSNLLSLYYALPVLGEAAGLSEDPLVCSSCAE